MLKRKIFDWSWESTEGQNSFAATVGFDDEKKSLAQVLQIEKLLDLHPCKMLDVGCGTGRQTALFAERGYDVCGIDVAKNFLRTAKNNARQKNLKIHYKLLRASELSEKNVYDFALAYHHSIGFLSESELKIHFRKICESIKKNGLFLFEMAGPKKNGKKQNALKTWKETEDSFILVDKKLEDNYRNEICIVIEKTTGKIKEYREHQRAFSLSELRHILKKAGFSSVECFADTEKTPATKSNFGIFVCKK